MINFFYCDILRFPADFGPRSAVELNFVSMTYDCNSQLGYIRSGSGLRFLNESQNTIFKYLISRNMTKEQWPESSSFSFRTRIQEFSGGIKTEELIASRSNAFQMTGCINMAIWGWDVV